MAIQPNEQGEPIWLRLPPDEIDELDEWAKEEKRSRAAQLSLIVQTVLTKRKKNETKEVASRKK